MYAGRLLMRGTRTKQRRVGREFGKRNTGCVQEEAQAAASAARRPPPYAAGPPSRGHGAARRRWKSPRKKPTRPRVRTDPPWGAGHPRTAGSASLQRRRLVASTLRRPPRHRTGRRRTPPAARQRRRVSRRPPARLRGRHPAGLTRRYRGSRWGAQPPARCRAPSPRRVSAARAAPSPPAGATDPRSSRAARRPPRFLLKGAATVVAPSAARPPEAGRRWCTSRPPAPAPVGVAVVRAWESQLLGAIAPRWWREGETRRGGGSGAQGRSGSEGGGGGTAIPPSEW